MVTLGACLALEHATDGMARSQGLHRVGAHPRAFFKGHTRKIKRRYFAHTSPSHPRTAAWSTWHATYPTICEGLKNPTGQDESLVFLDTIFPNERVCALTFWSVDSETANCSLVWFGDCHAWHMAAHRARGNCHRRKGWGRAHHSIVSTCILGRFFGPL